MADGGEGFEAGTPGPVAMALHAAVVRDFEDNGRELTPVPYDIFESN